MVMYRSPQSKDESLIATCTSTGFDVEYCFSSPIISTSEVETNGDSNDESNLHMFNSRSGSSIKMPFKTNAPIIIVEIIGKIKTT